MINSSLDSFFYNLQAGKNEQAAIISQDLDLNMRNIEGHTALHIACKIGYMEMIRFLICRGADINIQDRKGNTPLHILAIYRNNVPEIVNYMVDSGADLETTNIYEDTPLLSALKNGRSCTAESLVKKGSNVYARGGANQTTLLWASVIGEKAYNLIKLFVEMGVDVNAHERGSHSTPLSHAVTYDDVKLTRYLLASGADPEHRLFDDRKVFEYAKSPEIKLLLEENIQKRIKSPVAKFLERITVSE